MRKVIFLISIVVILVIFPLSASAEASAEGYLSEFESILPKEMSGITEDGEMLIEKFSIKGILLEFVASLKGESGDFIKFFLVLVGGVSVFSLATECHESFVRQIEAAVGLVISMSIFPVVNSALSSVAHSLSEISVFFNALTPIVVGVTALGGGVSAAGVQAGGMYTAFSVIGTAGTKLFLSLSSFGLAVASLSALGNSSAVSVGKGIKGVFTWCAGIFTTLITSVFALQTLVASAADSAAMRTAKYMASGLIPVVGSAVSGALATLASGLSYAKSLIGGVAIAVILSMVISPLVMLLLYRLALTLATNISTLTGAEIPAKIFTVYRFIIDMTVAAYTLSTIVYLFQVVLFLRIGVALL